MRISEAKYPLIRGWLRRVCMFACVAALVQTTVAQDATSDGGPAALKLAVFNVKYGELATPEEVAQVFADFQPDMLLLSEVPNGGWSERIGDVLEMPYVYVGSTSSANHKDKYKSIISRTPLLGKCEYVLEHDVGWSPASVVRAVTILKGIPVVVYSLHIANSGEDDGHIWQLAHDILPRERSRNVIVAGDFNYRTGDDGIRVLRASGYGSVWEDMGVETETMSSVVGKNTHALIDHVFYRAGGAISSSEGGVIHLEEPLSDHHPVWASLSFSFDPSDESTSEFDIECQ